MESTTSPLRSGHAEEAATSLRSRREVVKSTHSLLGNRQCVYDVWLMTGLKNNKRIASKETLREAYAVVTPKHRKEYVYILKWTPAFPKPVHVWGCLCGKVHTNDLRPSVRRILRG